MMGTHDGRSEVASQPSGAVVEAVAGAEQVDPPEIPDPLFDSIDPDALDALVASSESVSITFSYLGYLVTVGADGTVELEA